ncbi:MAG: hypothetical protein WCC27_15080 [Acidobacteriaceae bacterium]
MLTVPELARVHDRYLSIASLARQQFHDTLGGKLLLQSGLSADGIATIVAVSIAGTASLCVDADADGLRQGLRAGLIDFVVGNLDEALRILKNELRRGLPISVGLVVEPEASLAAMIDRGLQPDLLSAVSQRYASIFLERGAMALPEVSPPDSSTSILLWTIAEDQARSMPRMARLASDCLDPARIDTAARRVWLERSPRSLGRAFGPNQCLRMSGAEIDAFLSRARSELPSATITRDGKKP